MHETTTMRAGDYIKRVQMMLAALVNARGTYECPVCGQSGAHAVGCWLVDLLDADEDAERADTFDPPDAA